VATLRTASDERLAAETALRDAVAAALGDEADRVELRTALGLAGRNLVDTARKVNAQLIVLAGRGSTSMLLGTVSQYVLRRAPCPVLVVRRVSNVQHVVATATVRLSWLRTTPEPGRAAAAWPASRREPTPRPQPPGASLRPGPPATPARRSRAASFFSLLPGQLACPRTVDSRRKNRSPASGEVPIFFPRKP